MRRTRRKKKRASETAYQLVNHALQRIGARDSARALKLLKRAKFKGVSPERIAPLLCCAYGLRAEDFERRGMTDQAMAAREQASHYAEAFAKMVPTASELVPLLKSLPDGPGFAFYSRYLRSNPPHAAAEAELADRLIVRRCFDRLAELDEGCQLRLDAVVVASALEPWDRGDWAGGLQLLRGLGSKSAFRAWVAFATAMDAYVRADAGSVRSALRTIPSSFPLRSAVKSLRKSIGASAGRGKAAPGRIGQLISGGRFAIPNRAQALRHAVSTESPSRIAKAIANFADAIDPHDPLETTIQLALALDRPASQGQIDYPLFWQVLRRVGPKKTVDLRVLRAGIQIIGGSKPHIDGTSDIADSLSRLKLLSPDPGIQTIVRSRILYKLAHALTVVPAWTIDYEEFEGIGSIVGDTSFETLDRYEYDPMAAAADLFRMSVKADPSNTDAHKGLVSVLRDSPSAKRAELVAAYEGYVAAVPEKPDPWIELAELRLSHNAYRKAQTALKKASRYASQDERVLDLLAVCSVLAAHRGIRDGRTDAAERDLADAESRMRPRSEPIVRATRGFLILDTAGRFNLRAAFEELVAACTPIVRIQTLSVILAAHGPGGHRGVLPRRKRNLVWTMLRDAVTKVCDECPDKLQRLVEPLPDSFRCVTSPQAVILNLSGFWAQILRAVPDTSMLTVFLVALEEGQWSLLRDELVRRLPRARRRAQAGIVLLFLATVRYLLGEDSGGHRFHRLKAGIPEAEREPVRLASEKLATAVRNAFIPELGVALRNFDFSILDEDRGLF